ncbi:MAG: phosphatidylserine decarboxylase proenzyme [Melioribacteraceae bacterium]|nr:MAG: phosphatidylserine decarboxylase proenzyme [Melioribacteraceae bacterium]
MLTKYGYFTIGVVTVIVFLLVVAGIYINNNIAKYALFVLGGLLMIFTLNFFRDPDRTPPEGDNIIVSPADGKVLIIKDITDHPYVEGECTQVSVFMSPLNVHVNRIPIDGVVEKVDYIKGEYLVAYHDKADKLNERSEIGIKSKHGNVFFTQVAGAVARRIVYELEPGQKVYKGERFGMIKFGSRVDVIVSKDWKLNVKEGDIVAAGETILFENVK